jgi:hypothetical protein
MEKQYVDELYHQLRHLYITNDITQKEAIMGLVSHLTQPSKTLGDYVGLLRFLTWYGEQFLLERVYSAITISRLRYERVVDIGAGFGWLGRGISNLAGGLPNLFIDKRQWPLIDIIADIETQNGRKRVLDEMKPNDLIVMGELLHCLNDPVGVLRPFSKWPIVAVEYYPEYQPAYRQSYEAQIKEFGCTPIRDISGIFASMGMRHRLFHEQPHVIVVAEPI